MIMKWSAVCLVAVAMLGCLCDAQFDSSYKPFNRFPKLPVPPVPPPPPPVKHTPQQTKQNFEKPLRWTYPEDPKPEIKPEVPFELRHPVPVATVTVDCREKDLYITAQKDLFGIGQIINTADLTLGTCPAIAQDQVALMYEAELHQCGSRLTMTEDALIYTFTLNYNPRPISTAPVMRTNAAAVYVECHYPRKHNVSSLALDPLWITYSATKISEEFLYFTLTLMTADWQFERPVYQYFLGDVINVEATIKQYFHVPLRVYVESCTATLSPDMNSSPRYSFIENHGCFVDAKLTGSTSKFLPRTDDTKLQFQIEAFRFQGADSGVLFITCHLKASYASYAIDSERRACSFMNGWTEASGSHGACANCDNLAGPSQGTGSYGPGPG
ncbi:zona pellucida sperm-binding protein 3-like, partial [Polymixia lowei]